MRLVCPRLLSAVPHGEKGFDQIGVVPWHVDWMLPQILTLGIAKPLLREVDRKVFFAVVQRRRCVENKGQDVFVGALSA